MFGFLKKKLKDAVKKFSKKAEESLEEEKVEDQEVIEEAKKEEEALLKEEVTEIPETEGEKEEHEREAKRAKEETKSEAAKEEAKKVPEKSIKSRITKSHITKSHITSAAHEEKEKGAGGEAGAVPEEREKPKAEEEKSGLFTKLKESFTKKKLSEEKFATLFWDLEVALLENNVAVEVIEKLKEDLKQELTSGKVSRLGLQELILVSLKKSIKEILNIQGFDLVERIKKSKKKPYVIVFIGVNGSGKTTTLAKIANKFQEEGLSVVMAASDTFRAAAIDQLAEHAHRLGIKLISQGYGADPAAVAYDAIAHAKAKALDVVMIDTAGRLHSNTNLMAELEKVVRVAKPDLKIFIGEATTGNDCVEQAKEFDKRVGIDAIILSKADVDEKGGAALSVSYVTGKPILYLGVGQAYGDLKRFDREEILRNLGL